MSRIEELAIECSCREMAKFESPTVVRAFEAGARAVLEECRKRQETAYVVRGRSFVFLENIEALFAEVEK